MSLINDMLRDLDGPTATPALPRRQSGSRPQPGRLRRWLLPALAALAVVVWLLSEWLRPQGMAPGSEASPALVAPALATVPPALEPPARPSLEPPARPSLEPPARPSPEPSVSVAPAPEEFVGTPAVPAVVDTELQLAKQRLLSSGYAALAANRLTVPNDNSAFYFFSTVLLMDPDNAGAQRGLASVRERYLQLLDDAVARQDAERAQALGTGARRAGLGADVVDEALAGLNAADQIGAALQSVAIVRSVESGSRAAAGATVDPGRYDRNLSRALVRNGLSGSESRALNWVATGAQVQETTLALIDHYSAAAARDKLQGLHEQLLERASPLADLAAAHLQWQQGAPEAAVRQLQTVQLRGNAELARLRLLGGLLQNADDSAGAETVYTQLVRSPQAGAHDWLGLAVALDRQGKTDAARQTWQHLVNQQDLGPGLASFANRRLQALALTGGR